MTFEKTTPGDKIHLVLFDHLRGHLHSDIGLELVVAHNQVNWQATQRVPSVLHAKLKTIQNILPEARSGPGHGGDIADFNFVNGGHRGDAAHPEDYPAKYYCSQTSGHGPYLRLGHALQYEPSTGIGICGMMAWTSPHGNPFLAYGRQRMQARR